MINGSFQTPNLCCVTLFLWCKCPLISCGHVTQGVAQHYLQQMDFMRLAPPPPLPPLPPPDEVEQPPKPPFADEEEEEEMLLREELLKSLANKRAVKAEVRSAKFLLRGERDVRCDGAVVSPQDASSSSGPPSPALRAVVQPSARNNLAAVSLNAAVSHARALKFVRGHPAPKAPFVVSDPRVMKSETVLESRLFCEVIPFCWLQLPRHKAVVVCLNASDDSDSDGESCSPAQSVIGGLESMIKEARRTVEVRVTTDVSPTAFCRAIFGVFHHCHQP